MTLEIWDIRHPSQDSMTRNNIKATPQSPTQWISNAGPSSQEAEAGSGGPRLSSAVSNHRGFWNAVDSVSPYANWPEILAA